ncbi:MAG: hypothetical protein HFH53_05760 [Hespellia sp.]|jgi:hypothetical protein|nr:hypothetical protein [Hespellia sp.]
MRFYQDWSQYEDRVALLGSDGVRITYKELGDYGKVMKEQITTRELVLFFA